MTTDEAKLQAEIREALDAGAQPPAEFLIAVLVGEIKLPQDILDRLIAKRLLRRQPCEVWSRVMGYYRPVAQWNIGKKQEFADRKMLDPKNL